jgi:hypothetical protein
MPKSYICCRNQGYGDVKGIFTTFLESEGTIYLDFFDIRHAMTASRQLYLSKTFNATAISVHFVPKRIMAQVFLFFIFYFLVSVPALWKSNTHDCVVTVLDPESGFYGHLEE